MAIPKKKGLDDYLKKGKTPPTKGSKRMPRDYDVMTPDMGYTMPTAKKQPKKIKKK